MFGRLIDHEAKNGNTEEVRRLVKKSSLFKPDIRSDEAKQIVAQIEAEIEAEKQAQEAEKQLQIAKREAEKQEKIAEQEAEDAKREVEAAISKVTTLSGSELLDFMDNTKNYKGKALRMTLRARNPIRSGGNIRFSGDASTVLIGGFKVGSPKNFDITIGVYPSSISDVADFDSLDQLPNISGGLGKVDITFLCEEGSLTFGNRAIRVVRP